MTIKEHILQELEQLNEKQLQKVDDFITVIKLSSNFPNQDINNLEKIANLYQEFTQEDRLLAEQGISEYSELLAQEDLL